MLLGVAVYLFGWWFLWIALLLALWLLLTLLFLEVYEVSLDDEGVCEFHSLLRRRRVRAQQIRSIKGGPRIDPEDSNDVVIRYEGGRVHLEAEDSLDFLLDLVELNPAIKIDTAPGWFQRVLDHAPLEQQQTGDDPIRDLRRVYTRNIRRELRNERVGRFVAFLGWWFFVSFIILCLSPLVLDRPLPFAMAGVIGGAGTSVVWLILKRTRLL